ncbi:Cas10/Cmr2 second palm domain-containing protein [Nocardiopsis valliformis]|uniref:Cas10/Cmr2 second palm domain-containing protein n=1 Tax=Nocardiopsis valliformis TaxID=239974 RepID=UPI00034A17B8|nr:type III-B CRISPR-associated protein Cas10/Cmr2 [Nocardiopsis valliformis]
MSEHDPRDLVVIALAGVQRYITESRSTADLRAASQIVARLAAEAVAYLARQHGAEMVFPAPGEQKGREGEDDTDDGIPNRVVARLPAGTGPTAARKTTDRLNSVWEGWMEDVFGTAQFQVPGWPVVQWVSVPAGSGSYEQAWSQAQRALAERKNTRNFHQPGDTPGDLCMLSPRWRAVDGESLPRDIPKHLRREQLSVANWVKRMWHRTSVGSHESFPSTNAIASLPYRHAVLTLWDTTSGINGLVRELRRAADALGADPIGETRTPGLPRTPTGTEANWLRGRGSRWIFPESWHVDALSREFTDTADEAEAKRADPEFVEAVRSGGKAAQALVELMGDQGVPAPSPHLAVLVQDLDSMGRHLSGSAPGRDGSYLDPARGHTVHTEVSARLGRTAARQRRAVEKAGGVVVYAGGDDLLALVPAAFALEATRACRETNDPGLPTASNGLLFFHHGSSLRQALAGAHELLEEAKELRNKNGLGVGFVRSSGSHARCVLPWEEEPQDGVPAPAGSPVDALELFVTNAHHPRARLSPRLLPDLLGERVHLDGGGEQVQGNFEALPYRVARAEMRRLVHRHTSLVPLPTSDRQGGDPAAENDDTGPAERDRKARKVFSDEATTALERMAPDRRLVDEGAVRVALFLRQEAH